MILNQSGIQIVIVKPSPSLNLCPISKILALLPRSQINRKKILQLKSKKLKTWAEIITASWKFCNQKNKLVGKGEGLKKIISPIACSIFI